MYAALSHIPRNQPSNRYDIKNKAEKNRRADPFVTQRLFYDAVLRCMQVLFLLQQNRGPKDIGERYRKAEARSVSQDKEKKVELKWGIVADEEKRRNHRVRKTWTG
jgi:hypothetical protein